MKLLYAIVVTPLVGARLHSKDAPELQDAAIDRDLQSQCAALMDKVGFEFPFVLDCTCKFGFMSFNFECASDVCPEDVVNEIGNSWNSTTLPFDTCLAPSFKGTYSLKTDVLETTSCTGTSNVTFNASAIADQAGVPNLAATLTTSLDAPEICVQAQHKANDFTTIETCSVTLDDQACPCEVCEGGKQVKLQCADLLATFFPEIPPAALMLTSQCIGLGSVNATVLLDRAKLVASQIEPVP